MKSNSKKTKASTKARKKPPKLPPSPSAPAQSSPDLYEALINTINGIVWEADANTFQFTFVSPRAESLLGYPLERWINEPTFWKDHIHPDDRTWAVEYCVNYTRDMIPHEFEYRMIAADGRTVWLKDVVTVISENGKPSRLRGIMLDITLQKQTEEALAENEEALRTIFNTMSEAVALNEIIYDENGEMTDYRILEVNRAFYSLADYSGSDVVGNIASQLYHMPHELIKNFWQQHKDRNEVVRTEFDSPLSQRSFYISTSPFRNNKFVTSFFDVTERKRVENALRESESKLRLFIEHSPAALAMFDSDMRYLAVSHRWVSDFHLGEQDLAGRSHYEIFPEIGEDWKSVHRRALSGEVVRKDNEIFIRQDGSVQWLEWEVRPWYSADGVIGGIIIFSVDITERKKADLILQDQKEYLELLNDMTRSVLISKDFDETLAKLADDMRKLMKADDCYITRWDEERQLAIPTATTANLAKPYSDESFELATPNMTASVMKTGQVLASDDVFASPYVNPVIAKRYPARSLLGVPLIFGDIKLGAALIAYNTSHRFTSEEIQRAEQAGHQIAIALWNSQQELEIEKSLREARALSEISRALSETGRIGLDNVLKSIVDSAKELIPTAEQAVIHLLDREQQVLIPRAVVGFEDAAQGKINMRLGEGVAGQVILNGQAINIADVETDSRFLREHFLPRFRSLLVCPIQSGEERLGTISVQSERPNAFSAGEQHLLGLLGVDAAIAIENARLLEVTQQGLKEVDALYRASRRLASSLDPSELMRDVVELLHENFGYYHVQIYMRDEETGDLVISQGAGEIGAQLMVEAPRIPAGMGITGHVAATGQPFLTNDVRSTPFYISNPLLPNTRSELCVPIKNNERTVGVLNLERDADSSQLTERDLQLVNAVAEQLSVSLQKADLYTNLQASLQEEKRMRTQLVQSERLALVGRLLASVSHELNNPLQAIQNALFLLKDERGISAQGRQDLNIILSEAERMAGLIERLRSSYRPAQAADFRAIQVNTLLENVHALVATHLRQNQIAFEFHPDPNLPAITGLPDQIKQVALNLVMNAVEAMRGGGRLKVVTAIETDNEISFSISDTGPGIDPAMLNSIFDPFVTGKETGTGLGLTICYDIIQQHNGRIVAENSPESGAVFTVWLPIRKQENP